MGYDRLLPKLFLQTTGSLILLLFFLLYIITLILFIKRRHLQPIYSHFPSLLVITSIFFLIQIYNSGTAIFFGGNDINFLLPPYFIDISIMMPVAMISLSYCLRCWRLYFIFKLSQKKIARGQANWFHKYKWLIKSKFLLGIYISILLFFIIIAFPFTIFRVGGFIEVIVGLAVAFPILPQTFAFIYLLRNIDDNFSIQKELKFVGFVALFVGVPYMILVGVFDTGLYEEYLFVLCIYLIFIATFTWPVIQTYKNQRGYTQFTEETNKEFGMSDKNPLALISILEDPEGLELFEKFCKNEFSIENVLFYKNVMEYNNCVESYKRKQIAVQIVNDFLRANSTCEINIEDNLKLSIAKIVDTSDEQGSTLTPSLFSQALTEIITILQLDTYVRFAISKMFKPYKNKVEAKKALKYCLEETGMIDKRLQDNGEKMKKKFKCKSFQE